MFISTKNLTLTVPLFLIPVLSNLPGTVARSVPAHNRPTQAASAQDYNYESAVGWTIARCLIGGCSIFIGTVQEISRPDHPAESKEPTTLFSPRVSVSIDEWVYGEPEQWEPYVQLDHVPIELSTGRAAILNNVWRGVKLETRERLLIAFPHSPPVNSDEPEILGSINRYLLVLSNVGLFSGIQAINQAAT
jgi:hypothetical protein